MCVYVYMYQKSAHHRYTTKVRQVFNHNINYDCSLVRHNFHFHQLSSQEMHLFRTASRKDTSTNLNVIQSMAKPTYPHYPISCLTSFYDHKPASSNTYLTSVVLLPCIEWKVMPKNKVILINNNRIKCCVLKIRVLLIFTI